MKVLSYPNPHAIEKLSPSGITAVISAYHKHAAEVGIEFVEPDALSYDLVAVHAGMYRMDQVDGPLVAHCHGLYWTADYQAAEWEYKANKVVIDSIRQAHLVTVPSPWVAMPLARDMHIQAEILPHGIDWQEWRPKPVEQSYVIWNKNRNADVCDPTPMADLARIATDQLFLTTFAPHNATENVKAIGLRPHAEMKELVESASIYLSTTAETFGIGILEAMAAGVPVLSFDAGNASVLVRHGVDGYLAKNADLADLQRGLRYVQKHREALGKNARQRAKEYGWTSVMQKLATYYERAISLAAQAPTISVIIPCYNYGHTLERAVKSVLAQTRAASEILVIDNNSTDDTERVANALARDYPQIRYLRCEPQGVAYARNLGGYTASGQYLCFLDADDEIAPRFLAETLSALEKDRRLGVAYSKLLAVAPDGRTQLSEWPDHYNYDQFLKKRNQVPTCCLLRRDLFVRAGGYRQRYAPQGAGAEDAEFFLRLGALGYAGALVTQEGLFHYHLGGRVSSNRSYQEKNWLYWHPWTNDNQHPFASMATPQKFSHPVRSYSTPRISVVIPCAPAHIVHLTDALDSLEAQTLRAWEAIVVIDAEPYSVPTAPLLLAYPFVRLFWTTAGGSGAGFARNLGAKAAKADLLLFLDADDWLEPEALSLMLQVAESTQSISYTDYVGHAYLSGDESVRLERANRLLGFDELSGLAQVLHRSADYDCALAQQQPLFQNGQFYIWNLISSLVPKLWHDQIGGFDEQMPSWEDWDYWIRMARRGHCFTRIERPLVHYRFATGFRREIGRQSHANLLDYLRDKYTQESAMPCPGCSGSRRPAVEPMSRSRLMAAQNIPTATPGDLVMVELIDGNYGKHPIKIRDADSTLHDYGYRRHGERFLVASRHASRFPEKFKPTPVEAAAEPAPPAEPPPPPEADDDELEIKEEFELPEEEEVKEEIVVKKPAHRPPPPKRKK